MGVDMEMVSGSQARSLCGVASLHGPLDLDNIGVLWGARKIRESWVRGLTASIECDTLDPLWHTQILKRMTSTLTL